MTTVSCIGIAVMDLLFTMDELPDGGGGKYYAKHYREIGGGVAANAAVAVNRLGGRARYFGRLGDDGIGDRILDELRSADIDVGGVLRTKGVASPVSAVLVDGRGERTIINYTSPDLFEGETPPGAVMVDDADAVLVDVRWPEGAAVALDAARAAGIPSVFDFDRPMDDGGAHLLERATHVAFSRSALAATSGTDDPVAGLERVSSRNSAWLAVTIGGEGVYWIDDGEVMHLPAFTVDVVDTVGAGDVFHGALALALAEGQAEAAAVRFASAAAALKCTRPGARAGIPNRSEVDALLKEAA